MFNKILNYFNDAKNTYIIFFFIVVFLCAVKLPALLNTDIQPWDEGMYATRVLSIAENGDLLDQSSHSVGKFYSGSHPPLLIWIGYYSSIIFGLNSVTLKLIPFVFGILCVLILILIGKNLFNPAAGIIASLVFTGNIIFNVFSKRFQFDIPYSFFILLSFYYFLLYLDRKRTLYNVIGGFVFGLCLMVKILVGLYIPIIIFIFYLTAGKKSNYKFLDIFIFTITGIALALPWHLYMLASYGSEFTDYFLKFHIIDRAFTGVEHNTKSSGVLYYFNYILSIFPFSILIFISLIKDLKNLKQLESKKIFLIIWFLTGLTIITLFRTRLEVYILLILAPGSLMLAEYLSNLSRISLREKSLLVFLTTLNILWSLTLFIRDNIQYKEFVFKNIFNASTVIIIAAIVIFFTLKFLINKLSVINFYYLFIFLFCISINVLFLAKIPEWENTYEISKVKNLIESSGRKEIIYIGSNYRANPQLSFYFDGIDLNWGKSRFNFELLDTKDGNEIIKSKLSNLETGQGNVIVEKDNINRTEYPESINFIPGEFKLIYKTKGYELYQK
jgi:4-amino-4-deoxy-L-arabinose transferase-like glycosyltransferase